MEPQKYYKLTELAPKEGFTGWNKVSWPDLPDYSPVVQVLVGMTHLSPHRFGYDSLESIPMEMREVGGHWHSHR